MPSIYTDNKQKIRHTDDMQDIITAVPSWLLRWGIALFFCVLVLIVSMSALIRYPDIIKTQLKIVSPDVAKPIVPKVSGKLVKLLVNNNDNVVVGQPLAYIESTANHSKVLQLLVNLKNLQKQAVLSQELRRSGFDMYDELGELQIAYQQFSQAYISYKASTQNGFLVKKKLFLQQDIADLDRQTKQLQQEKQLQQRDLALAEDEYRMHKKLEQQKVETPAELRQQESKYLAKKAPLLQTDAALITAGSNYLAKQKEIMELDNQVNEERSRFEQALNSLISQAEDWKSKYVLVASQQGKVTFAGLIQQNQVVNPGQEVFYINAGNNNYFGEMTIPQNKLGKVKQGQQVLIKLRSYPFEEYGMLRGSISDIADVPYQDSVFISKVALRSNNSSDMKKPIHLKQGMIADAEIVTEDATILQRLTRNIIKVMHNN
ncbi:HlyD family efflux transporter periplasmic adaptor subunit [Inquilinus sp. KBS0705]|nr:HlyD family efflux transporter periplasmic adaptor subunit [Inquilinus sp. KBS0705]